MHFIVRNAILAIALSAAPASAQNLTQADFTGVLVPQYIGSGTATRLPYFYRATVSNLAAGTTYRYFTQGAQAADLSTASPGAGNSYLINNASGAFSYTTGPSLATAGNHETFTTDASGSFTGWFGFLNTGNARFTAGNTIYPSIVIGDTAGLVLHRRALNQTMTVLAYSASAGANNGTGIRGTSPGGVPKNFVALYDNVTGTGSPLAVTVLESDAQTGAALASLVPFYSTSVEGQNFAWGTIIPNTLSNGVRRVEQRAFATGNIVNSNTDSDGAWPSSANTVNPAGGATELVLTSTDAPLPVSVSAFSIE